jgi:UDPglucose 6-dehydrogenase
MIGFTGLSHLGIVSAIATAAKGFDVVAHDPDAALCSALAEGRLPLYEPGLAELLAQVRRRIRFTSDFGELRRCHVMYFSQDVPTDRDNQSDMSQFPRRIDEVARHVAPRTTLVVLSQVPPGFTRGTVNRLEDAGLGRELTLYYQVETLIFGQAVERALKPERFIVGCAEPAATLPAPYAALLGAFGCPILPMRYESAELAKISINFCLVASITVANTLAEVCESIGADWSEIVPALKLDRRIGRYAYLSPGLGIAGGNLERDLLTVRNLSREYGTESGIIDAWLANSRYRRDWVLRTIHREGVPRVAVPTIAVWGLAYKQDTTSTKNSPALALLDSLGSFPIRVHDPQAELNEAKYPHVTQVDSALEACEGADVLVIMTPWAEYASVDLGQAAARMRASIVIDPFNVLDSLGCEQHGLAHFRLGIPLSSRRSVA